MYCAKCEELMTGEPPIVDDQGYSWHYDVQVCEGCRPRDRMSSEELRLFLGVSEEDWDD